MLGGRFSPSLVTHSASTRGQTTDGSVLRQELLQDYQTPSPTGQEERRGGPPCCHSVVPRLSGHVNTLQIFCIPGPAEPERRMRQNVSGSQSAGAARPRPAKHKGSQTLHREVNNTEARTDQTGKYVHVTAIISSCSKL